MKCSDCGRYKTKECSTNPRGEDWDMAESYGCFVLKSEQAAATKQEETLEKHFLAQEVAPKAKSQKHGSRMLYGLLCWIAPVTHTHFGGRLPVTCTEKGCPHWTSCILGDGQT